MVAMEREDKPAPIKVQIYRNPMSFEGYADSDRGDEQRIADFTELVGAYRRLHDRLSDMIEGGRLLEQDIPSDYTWLVQALEALAHAAFDENGVTPGDQDNAATGTVEGVVLSDLEIDRIVSAVVTFICETGQYYRPDGDYDLYPCLLNHQTAVDKDQISPKSLRLINQKARQQIEAYFSACATAKGLA